MTRLARKKSRLLRTRLFKTSIPAADLRAGFLQMMLERRLFVVGAISEAGPQEVQRVARTIGVQRNQGQIATFLVRGGLQRGQAMLHHPGGRPVRLASVEHFEIVEHANHDGPRADRLERHAQVGPLESDALAEPSAALVSRKDPSSRIRVDKQRSRNRFVAREKML